MKKLSICILFSICASGVVAAEKIPLPQECVVSGAPNQIRILNGFVRGIGGDGEYQDRWQSIQTNVFVNLANSVTYPYYLVIYGGMQVATKFSPSFASEADGLACLEVLVPLLSNRNKITPI